MSGEHSITDLLNNWQAGDRAALDRLVEIVYPELHESARRAMNQERREHTLTPTALVNEVYLHLQKKRGLGLESRSDFFAFAASLMRRVLVDHARARKAKKRGEGELLSLEGIDVPEATPAIDILVLEEVLEKLEKADPRLARHIELRVFAGLKEKEIAQELGLGRATVQRDWQKAKLVLAKLLSDGTLEST